MDEFSLIDEYFRRRQEKSPWVIEGIGDDAAVVGVPPGHELVMATDTLVAGVHFAADAKPYDVGWKALAVNLSDLAAMGADPACALLNLTLPNADSDWLDAFATGFFTLAERFKVALVGGDTTQGPLTVSVQVSGWVPRGEAILRSGAQAGDKLFVTGDLGSAALGLKCQQGEALGLSEAMRCEAARRLDRPEPRVETGCLLRHIASAAIDVSDGLLADVGHLLVASGNRGCRIQANRIPLSPIYQAAMETGLGMSAALTGGDDYELCLTIPPDRLDAFEALRANHSVNMVEIGEIEQTPGIRVFHGSQPMALPASSGYRHFGEQLTTEP